MIAITAAISAAMIPGFTNPLPFRTFVRQNWLNIITQFACLGLAMAIYTFANPLSPPLIAAFDGLFTTSARLRLAQPLRA